MHKHNHDLIATLAERVLAAELADAAEAEISACPECSAELAEQRLALAAMQAAPAAALTAAEAAGLRDAVAAELRVADPAPAPPARPPRRSAWVAVAAAAGLAAVIAVVPVIGLISPAGDDDSAMTVAFELPADEPAEESALRNDLDASDGQGEMAPTAPAGASSVEAPATTTAPATTEAAAETTTSLDTLALGEALSSTGIDGEAAIREVFAAGPQSAYGFSSDAAKRSTAACGAEAEQHLGNEVVLVEAPAFLDDGRPVILYATGDWAALVAFGLDDCSAAFTLP